MNKTDVITAAINYKNDIIDLDQFKTIVEQCFGSQHSGNAHVGSSAAHSVDETVAGVCSRCKEYMNGDVLKHKFIVQDEEGLCSNCWSDIHGM